MDLETKTNKILDLSIDEHALAYEYACLCRDTMEDAQEIIFKKHLNSDMPAGADMSISKWWNH